MVVAGFLGVDGLWGGENSNKQGIKGRGGARGVRMLRGRGEE